MWQKDAYSPGKWHEQSAKVKTLQTTDDGVSRFIGLDPNHYSLWVSSKGHGAKG